MKINVTGKDAQEAQLNLATELNRVLQQHVDETIVFHLGQSKAIIKIANDKILHFGCEGRPAMIPVRNAIIGSLRTLNSAKSDEELLKDSFVDVSRERAVSTSGPNFFRSTEPRKYTEEQAIQEIEDAVNQVRRTHSI